MSTPTPEQQRRARIFGVLFALTFITSIAGLLLYDPVLNDADYILGDGADTRVRLGALCEIFLAITNTAPPSCCGPSSGGRARRSRSVTSPVVSSSPSSSSSA